MRFELENTKVTQIPSWQATTFSGEKGPFILKEQRCCIGEALVGGKGGEGLVGSSLRSRCQKGKGIRRKEKGEGDHDNVTSTQGRFCVLQF